MHKEDLHIHKPSTELVFKISIIIMVQSETFIFWTNRLSSHATKNKKSAFSAFWKLEVQAFKCLQLNKYQIL